MVSGSNIDAPLFRFICRRNLFIQRSVIAILALFYLFNNTLKGTLYHREFCSILGRRGFFSLLRLNYRIYYSQINYVMLYGNIYHRELKKVGRREGTIKLNRADSIRELREQGRPVIVVTIQTSDFLHLTINKALCSSLKGSLKGFDVIAYFENAHRIDYLNSKISEHLELPFRVINVGAEGSALKVVRALKGGNLILCPIDFTTPFARNIKVDFFSRLLDRPAGIMELAKKLDAAIVPALACRRGGELNFDFMEPIYFESSKEGEAEIEEMVKRVNSLFEAEIRKYPEQWILWETVFNAENCETNEEYRFTEHRELYFCPAYNPKVWSESFIEGIHRMQEKSFSLVKSYVDIGAVPDLLFADAGVASDVLSDLGLPKSTESITYRSEIYFFKKRIKNFQALLTHEMFHVGINQVMGDDISSFPEWLNESIAYYLEGDRGYNRDSVRSYLAKNRENVIKWMEKGILRDPNFRDSYVYCELIKSFGSFFCSRYSPSAIKGLIGEIKSSKDCAKSIAGCLGIALPELIMAWIGEISG